MMKDARDIFLALVRNALWGTPCELKERPDWPVLAGMARQQTLSGLIAETISGLPEDMQPDMKTKMQLHSVVTRIYQSHSMLNRRLAQVKTLLDDNGIRSVLFKGQGLALNYPNPLSRQCGDIDIYVGEKNFLKAMDLLEPGVPHDVRRFRHTKHFNVDSGGVHVELHRIAEILPGVMADRRFQEWTVNQLLESDLRSVEIGGVEVSLPPVDFDALYIINHAWHHFINGGIGLRQICDWSLYLHRFHDEIDAAQLKRNLKSFRLTRAWQVMGSIAVHKLGLPESECPLYTGEGDPYVEKVMDMIFNDGNFGYYSAEGRKPRPKGHLAGKFHSLKKQTRRIYNLLWISPAEVIHAWMWYVINGIRNITHKVG